MVTLLIPFRNELVEIIDRKKLISIYDEKFEDITRKLRECDTGCDYEQLVQQLNAVGSDDIENRPDDVVLLRGNQIREAFSGDANNVDDFNRNPADGVLSNITRRKTSWTSLSIVG